VALAEVTAAPLVVTLELDPPTQERFDRERAQFFPPGRTQVGAHVTLFHAVPGDALAVVTDDLAAAASRAPFPITVAGLLPLGRGVAYRLVSTELSGLHRGLQTRWWDTLTAQDREGFRAHVTVQNKVRPEEARATLDELNARFLPFQAEARGLLLWRYDGGPWTALRRFAFASPPTPPRGR
jgi:2'-5' RNA ligase